MKHLDIFTNGYITAALWSSVDESGASLDENFSEEDFSVAAIVQIESDCAAFQKDNEELLAQSKIPSERAGMDFWFNRNRHDVGFRNEGCGQIGEKLSEAAKAWGTQDIHVGDDKQLHVS